MKVMEQKRLTMSTSFKLITPLINENLKSEYIINYSDFEGTFNKDINKPYLRGHIFLVYNYRISKKTQSPDNSKKPI